jgi:biopolymer transport protein ExbD
MKLGKTRNKVSTEFNMSSMTDIVFLLLIFFMITSTMVTTNALVLPKAKGKTDSNKNITVNITKDLQFFVDKDPIDETQLEAQLLTILPGVDDKGRAIILRAEQGVPIEKAVYVMDIANRNQIKIVLAVDPK